MSSKAADSLRECSTSSPVADQRSGTQNISKMFEASVETNKQSTLSESLY